VIRILIDTCCTSISWVRMRENSVSADIDAYLSDKPVRVNGVDYSFHSEDKMRSYTSQIQLSYRFGNIHYDSINFFRSTGFVYDRFREGLT